MFIVTNTMLNMDKNRGRLDDKSQQQKGKADITQVHRDDLKYHIIYF